MSSPPLLLILIYCILPLQAQQGASDRQVVMRALLQRWRRDLLCPAGEYYAIDHCCQNCKAGSHVTSHCGVPNGIPQCAACEDGTYIEQDNGHNECHRCQDCQTALGQEVLHACTATGNTDCRCLTGFFCKDGLSPDGSCQQCQPCTQCGNGEAEAEQCTPVKDTVCNQSRKHLHILISICVSIFVAIAAILFGCRKKKGDLPLPTTETRAAVLPTPAGGSRCPPHLKDIDLEKLLHVFANHMDKKQVLSLARRSLSPVKIDEIENNYPTDIHEQKYHLLKAWYNDHGRTGAFQNLVDSCNAVTAEALIRIAEKERLCLNAS